MYNVTTLETCRFGLDGGAMFGVVPKTLWERAYAPSDSKNRIPMAARALLLSGNNKVVLVDTGNSPEMDEKLLGIYNIDFSDFTIEGSLREKGYAATDVTDVILTHLHFDHAGGAVTNGKPRFPNATYYVQADHLSWARDPQLKDRASFDSRMFEPLVEHGVLTLVEGNVEILPGIQVRTVNGHTRSMQIVIAETTLGTVLYPADLFPTAAHLPMPYGMAYDNFPLTTIKEKQDIYDEMIGEQWIVVFEHDAIRAAGYVEMSNKGPILSKTIDI